jgi:protein TonB
MKPSVQKFKSDQPKELSKREDKRRVNHKWNSRLFFQIGLVVSLIITILVVESTIGLTFTKAVAENSDPMMDPPAITYVVEKPETVTAIEQKIVEQKPVIKNPVITDVITVLPNTAPITMETPVAAIDNPPVVYTPALPDKPVVNSGPKDINTVEFVPVFPGCESLTSNEERKQCLSDKIRAFIGRKFNSDEFSYLDSGKTFRIDVQFKIDTKGNITEVRSRAPERSLEQEALRVINLLPPIKPGMQGNMPVEVYYRVPITFKTN